MLKNSSVTPNISTLVGVLCGLFWLVAPAQGGIIDLPGLTSVTFYEVTGPTTASSFGAFSTQLATRLNDPLGSNNEDFHGLTNENYDVFYSDANGTPNVHGECVTIEAVYPNSTGGGGLNIAEVQFNFANSPSRFADRVCSSVQLGGNAIPGSQSFAVDGNLNTFSTMGNTAGYPGDPTRLRLTVGLVPEPSTLILACVALALLAVSKCLKRVTDPQKPGRQKTRFVELR